MAADYSIPLAQVIRALRAEVLSAQDEGKGTAVHFRLGQVDLEFQLVISKEGTGQGSINIGVLSLGAGGKVNQSETHRVKLTLNPVGPGGKEVELAGKVPRPPKA